MCRDIRPPQAVVPLRGGAGRPHRLGHQDFASRRRGCAENLDIGALDAKALEQRMHGILRMVRGRRRRELSVGAPRAADAPPALFVELGVEARQHHGAMREFCDGVQEFRRCRHRAGGACGDHRPAMMFCEPRGFRLDQQVAASRRFNPGDFGEIGRPHLTCDPQKSERVLPVFVELVRHESVERGPVDAARHHVVDQPRQGRPPTRASRPAPPTTSGEAPGDLAQPATNRASASRRSSSPSFGGMSSGAMPPGSESSEKASSSSSMSPSATMRGRIDGVRAEHVKEDAVRQAPRAPGRQIKGRLRQPFRLRARLETLHEPAIDQRRNDGAQERHGDGNTENAHGLPDSGSGCIMAWQGDGREFGRQACHSGMARRRQTRNLEIEGSR